MIPITRSRRQADSLSYFSTKELNRGDLVLVPLRGKTVAAIVTEASDAKLLKSEIKTRNFKLKPVTGSLRENFLSAGTLTAVSRLAQETFLPESVILFELIPKHIISSKVVTSSAADNAYHQETALKGSFEERLSEYRALIREHFARGKSLIIVSPDGANLARLENGLEKGIASYIFSFSSALAGKKYLERWNRAALLAHPVLILGTPQILSFERQDLETIVIDEEGSELYYPGKWRRLDFRKAAEVLAREKKMKLIRSDEVLQVETLWKAEAGLIDAKTPPLARIHSEIESAMFHLTKPEKASLFSWFSPELVAALEASRSANEKILIFVNRKGFSSFTVCADCGRAILCPACSVPAVLHAPAERKKEFLCHHCLKSSEVPERCPHCLSWRLKDYGLGLEKIELELKKLFPRAELGRLDRELIKGGRPGPEFFKPQIIAASEMILSYPEIKFDFTGVISLDHLFTIPDFRMSERIFRLITALKEKTRKKIVLQSRFPQHPLLLASLSGNISQFYQAEIKEREALKYPPFSALVKLERTDGDRSRLKAQAEKAAGFLGAFRPLSSPSFAEKIKNKYRWNIVLKVPPGAWTKNQEFRRRLEALQGSWDIVVDPQSLL